MYLEIERDDEGTQRHRRVLPARSAPGYYLRHKLQREEWVRLDYDPTKPIHLQSDEYHRRFREKWERINGQRLT